MPSSINFTSAVPGLIVHNEMVTNVQMHEPPTNQSTLGHSGGCINAEPGKLHTNVGFTVPQPTNGQGFFMSSGSWKHFDSRVVLVEGTAEKGEHRADLAVSSDPFQLETSAYEAGCTCRHQSCGVLLCDAWLIETHGLGPPETDTPASINNTVNKDIK